MSPIASIDNVPVVCIESHAGTKLARLAIASLPLGVVLWLPFTSIVTIDIYWGSHVKGGNSNISLRAR